MSRPGRPGRIGRRAAEPVKLTELRGWMRNAKGRRTFDSFARRAKLAGMPISECTLRRALTPNGRLPTRHTVLAFARGADADGRTAAEVWEAAAGAVRPQPVLAAGDRYVPRRFTTPTGMGRAMALMVAAAGGPTPGAIVAAGGGRFSRRALDKAVDRLRRGHRCRREGHPGPAGRPLADPGRAAWTAALLPVRGVRLGRGAAPAEGSCPGGASNPNSTGTTSSCATRKRPSTGARSPGSTRSPKPSSTNWSGRRGWRPAPRTTCAPSWPRTFSAPAPPTRSAADPAVFLLGTTAAGGHATRRAGERTPGGRPTAAR